MTPPSTMRRERLFSQGGFYSFIVDSNVLLHQEAIARGGALLAEQWAGRPATRPLRLLDLACGGLPVTTAAWMAGFAERPVHYSGVDINPDQIAAAGHFPFPAHVRVDKLLEGSAWDLRGLDLAPPYDLIYMGMNLHHATPEEIHFLGRQLGQLLAEDGLFVNHDWFRPATEPYQRRPDAAPEPGGESYLLVATAALAEAGVPEFGFPEQAWTPAAPAWKARYRDDIVELLIRRGGDPEGARSSGQHIQERDYPVSVPEAIEALSRAGLRVSAQDYAASGAPLGEYFAMLVARPG